MALGMRLSALMRIGKYIRMAIPIWHLPWENFAWKQTGNNLPIWQAGACKAFPPTGNNIRWPTTNTNNQDDIFWQVAIWCLQGFHPSRQQYQMANNPDGIFWWLARPAPPQGNQIRRATTPVAFDGDLQDKRLITIRSDYCPDFWQTQAKKPKWHYNYIILPDYCTEFLEPRA